MPMPGEIKEGKSKEPRISNSEPFTRITSTCLITNVIVLNQGRFKLRPLPPHSSNGAKVIDRPYTTLISLINDKLEIISFESVRIGTSQAP
jgi:hypothetical protein